MSRLNLEDNLQNDFKRYSEIFFSEYESNLLSNWRDSHNNSKSIFEKCYSHGTVFQTINSLLTDKSSCLELVREMQSDAVASFVEAMLGLYRNSLATCRSILEHSIGHIYFLYHPIEFKWWTEAKFKLEFGEHSNFIMKIDVYNELDKIIDLKQQLNTEYQRLSKFVHGHGMKHMHSFDTFSEFKYDGPMLNQWATHYCNICRLSTILILIDNKEGWYNINQTERNILSNILLAKEKEAIKKVLEDSDFFNNHL